MSAPRSAAAACAARTRRNGNSAASPARRPPADFAEASALMLARGDDPPEPPDAYPVVTGCSRHRRCWWHATRSPPGARAYPWPPLLVRFAGARLPGAGSELRQPDTSLLVPLQSQTPHTPQPSLPFGVWFVVVVAATTIAPAGGAVHERGWVGSGADGGEWVDGLCCLPGPASRGLPGWQLVRLPASAVVGATAADFELDPPGLTGAITCRVPPLGCFRPLRSGAIGRQEAGQSGNNSRKRCGSWLLQSTWERIDKRQQAPAVSDAGRCAGMTRLRLTGWEPSCELERNPADTG
jgi:hypothetical protein